MRSQNLLFIPITKVDEERREITGTITQEIADRDGEVLDYESSKPFFEEWSNYFERTTGGKSVGNLRAMHRNVSAGKLTQIAFDDSAKRIDVVAKVVDDDEWNKVLEGVYTGFSAAGRLIRKWTDAADRTLKRYTAKPYEVSLADYPAVPTATFEIVKIGGTREQRGFKKVAARSDASAGAGESKYGDVEFADEKNKKYPIDTKSHVRNALARWGDSKNRAKYSAKDQATIGRRIRGAARKQGVDVSEKAMLAGDFAKGLYEVQTLAGLVQSVAYLQRSIELEDEYEGDEESQIADRLRSAVEELASILEEMTGEELSELLVSLGASEDFEAAAKLASFATFPAFMKRLAKQHVSKLADVVSGMNACYKMLGDHCEKLSAFHGDVSGQSDAGATEKTAGATSDDVEQVQDDDLTTTDAGGVMEDKTKVAAAAAATGTQQPSADDFAKLTQRIETFEKRIGDVEKENGDLKTEIETVKSERDAFAKLADEAASTGAQLVEQLTGGKRPALKVVGKGDDNADAAVETRKVASGEEPKTPVEAFKKAFENPRFEGELPGQRVAAGK